MIKLQRTLPILYELEVECAQPYQIVDFILWGCKCLRWTAHAIFITNLSHIFHEIYLMEFTWTKSNQNIKNKGKKTKKRRYNIVRSLKLTWQKCKQNIFYYIYIYIYIYIILLSKSWPLMTKFMAWGRA